MDTEATLVNMVVVKITFSMVVESILEARVMGNVVEGAQPAQVAKYKPHLCCRTVVANMATV